MEYVMKFMSINKRHIPRATNRTKTPTT
jgi:hypothetical protein